MTSSREQHAESVRPGARLRDARLAKGASLEEAATVLKVKPRILEALEADDYAVLPEPVFVRGFMRRYAAWLALDADRIVACFESFYQAETGHAASAEARENPVRVISDISEDRLRLRTARAKASRDWPIGGSLALTALLLAGLWFWRQGGLPHLPVSAAASSPGTTTEQVLPNTFSVPVGNDRLQLELSGDTGVEVRDAGGSLLATGAHHAGERLDLHGQSPFSIELSRAEAVRLTLNGEAINLSPYTVNGAVNFRLSR